jgi:maltooligosyltrehalose trehalohydrolase
MQGLFATGRRGAHLVEGGVAFSIWAPRAMSVELELLSGERSGTHAMHPNGEGLWGVMLEQVVAGDRYFFAVGGRRLADPCSRFQPEGIHGPSEVVNPQALFSAQEPFLPPPLTDLVIYELHVGAFTAQGTFEAAAQQLSSLRDLGFNCVELMPPSQFAGGQSWGYEAVHPHAVAAAYGGPTGMARFVETAHALGMAVMVDGSYDHLGSAAAYLAGLGPYFVPGQEKWDLRKPSRDLNLDGAGAAPVREYALQAALAWLTDYRVDGLKLTSHHGVNDLGPKHLWREIAERVSVLSGERGREIFLIGEGTRNEVRLIQSRIDGGFGLDAAWAEDFHHALQALLTRNRHGKLIDFGSVDHLKRAVAQGFAFEGEWSRFHGGPHGTFARREPTERFVIFSQSHETGSGGRSVGERLSITAGAQAERLALTLTLFCPGIPLVFMGQEYGERAPFLTFEGEDGDAIRLQRSKLDLSLRGSDGHRGISRLAKDLIALRSKHPVLRDTDRQKTVVEIDQRRRLICVRRGDPGQRLLLLCSFAKEAQAWENYLPEARWEPLLDCADTRYEGTGRATEPLSGGFSTYFIDPLAGRIFREAP